MNNEELRQRVVEGIDAVLEAPWVVRRFYTADQLRLLRAMRRYWMDDRGEQLTALSALYAQEPARANVEEKEAE